MWYCGHENSSLQQLWVQTFNVVKRAHRTGHVGRDRRIKETQRKYANISTNALELFKLLHQRSQKKRKIPRRKGVVGRPVPRIEFASRGQAVLVNIKIMNT